MTVRSNRARRCGLGLVGMLVGVLGACGGAPDAAKSPAPVAVATSGDAQPARRGTLPAFVPKRRFLPDLGSAVGDAAISTPTGSMRLVDRMRILMRPDGTLLRADELLPLGNKPVAMRLPRRFGGGFAFLVNSARGTELWRAETWLGDLVPLASFSGTPDSEEPLVIGFDRLYVRLKSLNQVVGVDPKSGAILGQGALPVAPAYGDMAFLDAWRGVVDTDLAGTLATFDAGATWTPLPRRAAAAGLVNLPRTASISTTEDDPDDGGDALIQLDGGFYTLRANGDLTWKNGLPPTRGDAARAAAGLLPSGGRVGSELDDALRRAPPGPLGRRPLRTALEYGYPDGPESALVARDGVLARVSLTDGRVLAMQEDAYPGAHLTCSGIALGLAADPKDRIGFVCGSAGGPTVVYELAPPLGLHEVMRFSGPRIVTESGQGAIVVRGACSDDTSLDVGVRPFCVRFADGTTREIRVRGDVGAERVIALGDGRVAILVPPRPGAQGQLSLLSGQSSKHLPLKLPESGAPREIETGMWMDGFHQSGPDELAGWIEAGGPVMGVRVKLDGTVSVGEAVDEPRGVLVSGRFAIAIGDAGRVLESSDTGGSWAELSLPRLSGLTEASRTRRCGPVGCVFGGWLKVGWDEPASERDLEDAPAPTPAKLTSLRLPGRPMSLSCTPGRSAPRPKGSSKKNAGESSSGWLAFRGVDPPPMEKGEAGLDNGAPFELVPLRAYAWGKKDADWARTGKLLIRWADRYAFEEVRSSAATSSPWSSEAFAADALGLGAMGYGVSFSATRDPGLPAALASACRAGASCYLFGMEEGQPVLPFRSSAGAALSQPIPGSAVRVGQSWLFLGATPSRDRIGLYRADLGNVKLLRVFDRPPSSRFNLGTLPKLVRRAGADSVGLLFVTRDGPLDRRGTRYVLPVDAESGDTTEPIRLGRPDFGDVTVSGSCDGRDGWLAEIPMTDPSPDVKLDGAPVTLEGAELRMRLDPGVACIDGGTATLSVPQRGDGKEHAADAFRVMVVDRADGGRAELFCKVN